MSERVAVALRYAWSDAPPEVLATGRRQVADRIVNLALAHDVPVRENAPVAKLLAGVPPGTPIPPKAFVAVAQILAFLAAVDELRSSKPEA